MIAARTNLLERDISGSFHTHRGEPTWQLTEAPLAASKLDPQQVRAVYEAPDVAHGSGSMHWHSGGLSRPLRERAQSR